MANLAIKGHATRGNEVIKILEMLGGANKYSHCGESESYFFFIQDGLIDCDEVKYTDDYVIYTLEEFLEKFPYKVGDKVHHIIDNENQIITDLVWDEDEVLYKTTNNFGYAYVNYLQPYKEETMEKEKKYYDEWLLTDYLEFENNDAAWADEVEVNLGKDYEIQIRGDKTFIVKKKSQYPKTYEECCKILDWNHRDYDRVGYNSELLCKLQVLLLCRDAYWKIAGWNPQVKGEVFYIPSSFRDLFPMPTVEMRDAFYENFKELIEQCKELL